MTSNLGFVEDFLLSKVTRFYGALVNFSFISMQRNGAGFHPPEVHSTHKLSSSTTTTTTTTTLFAHGLYKISPKKNRTVNEGK